jgi:sodium pump decarboxylase gamma subunit
MMGIEETLRQSTVVMGVGMGVVFLTLLAFVLIIAALRTLLSRFAPGDSNRVPERPEHVEGNAAASGDEPEVAAAMAAILHHKRRHQA